MTATSVYLSYHVTGLRLLAVIGVLVLISSIVARV